MVLHEGERWRLYAPVTDRAQRPGAAARVRPLQVEPPAMVLGEIARDASARTALRGVDQRAFGGPPWVYDEASELRRRFERALARGLRVVVRTERAPLPASREARDTEPPPAPEAPAFTEETTWIAIELVEGGDPPRPVPYARYRVTLPDGSVREGTLDAMGLARVDGIDPGTCKVSFPDIDGGEWAIA